MAIERVVDPADIPLLPNEEENLVGEDVEIGVATLSEEDEDGNTVVTFGEEDEGSDEEPVAFDANLAEHIDENKLKGIASELVGDYKMDERSRAEWEQAFIDGLELLGIGFEEKSEPWEGACGVYHPMLMEAAVNFQSQAIQEIFPAQGPVRTKVYGAHDPARIKQAERIKGYMNYLLTERMTEYRIETERLLFNLSLAGDGFRKIYYDPTLGRPASMYAPSEDVVINYGEADLATCGRITHRMKRSPNDVRKLQALGYYRDIELPEATPQPTRIEKKRQELIGEQVTFEQDDRHTLLEMSVDLDLPGFEDENGIMLPYIVTIDLTSQKVLAIRRNWTEGDPNRERLTHFSHYQYIPGMGFYGLGLIHLIGGMAKSSTSILRQLVDAGTLANLPAALKARGLRVHGDDTPLGPGEMRDVDVPAGSIKDNIAFLPYKEPSQVLYNLMSDIVSEARRFASQAEVKASEMSNEAPVGTTLALLERSLKVVTAIQARLHAAQKNEFRILTRVIRDHGPTEYPYDVEDRDLLAEDFDDRIDIIPVSNPNAGTMSMRIMQAQAALQLASQDPTIYNRKILHRQMLEAIEFPNADEIIPLDDEMPPKDPVTENMDIINGGPAKAFSYQDHEAHIAVHMAAMQDPKLVELVGQSPNAKAIMGEMESHIREHVAFQYRRSIEKELGFDLPEDEMPEDVERRISSLVAPAAEQLLGKHQAEQEQQRIQQQMEDPVIQQRNRELDIEEQEAQNGFQAKMAEIQRKREDALRKEQLERDKMAQRERTDGARIGAQIGGDLLDAKVDAAEISAEDRRAGVRAGIDIARDATQSNRKKSGDE